MDRKNDKAKGFAGSKPAAASGKSALKSTDATNAGAATAKYSTAAGSTAAGSRLGQSSLGALNAAKATSKPIEEVKDGESSGYSNFSEEEIE